MNPPFRNNGARKHAAMTYNLSFNVCNRLFGKAIKMLGRDANIIPGAGSAPRTLELGAILGSVLREPSGKFRACYLGTLLAVAKVKICKVIFYRKVHFPHKQAPVILSCIFVRH